MEVVDAPHDDVGARERGERHRPRDALRDGLAPRPHADPPDRSPDHPSLALPKQDVESHHSYKAMAVGSRDTVGVDQNEFAHTEMRELLGDVAPAAAEAHDCDARSAERELPAIMDDESLPGEGERAIARPRLRPRPPVHNGGAEPAHVERHLPGRRARHGDEARSVAAREDNRAVRTTGHARREHRKESAGALAVVSRKTRRAVVRMGMEDDKSEPPVHRRLDRGDHGGPAPSPVVSRRVDILVFGKREDAAEQQRLAAS